MPQGQILRYTIIMALPHGEIGRRIRAVREQIGLSQENLAEMAGISASELQNLESGSLPSFPGDLILIVARALKTDFRYFILREIDDVETGTRNVYRALSDPSPSDRLAIRRFVSFCINECDLEALLGRPLPTSPPSYAYLAAKGLAKDQGKRVAEQERKRLQLAEEPIENIFQLLRSQGVRLFRQRLEDSKLSGLTIFHSHADVCVLVNFQEDLYRQFFSAAHEYAHVLFDRDKIEKNGCIVSYYTQNELQEIRANAFAAEFLLPTEGVLKERRPSDLESLSAVIGRIARKYKVNTGVVAIRTKEVGWITEKTLASFNKRRPVVIRRGEKRDPDVPPDLTSAQVERWEHIAANGVSSYYLGLLRSALTQDLITFGRFSEMLDMTPSEAAEFIANARLAI
jgi:Zn-dependent peptidase ImmA (M78 family)/DNA-binding XRE family transcriptional regulator